MHIINKFKNMTIKHRFTISTLTVLFITMSLYAIIRIIISTVSINKDISQKIETTTKLAALSFQDAIWNLNIIGIKEISDALFQDREIGYIMVKAEGLDEIYNKYNTGQIYDNKNLIIKKVKVLRDDLTIGEVTIGITKYYRIKGLQNDIATIILSVLMMIFVLWFAIDFVSRIVTKSIYDLSLGTDEISNGNLTYILPVNSKDEIGELANKFNNMTKSLYNMLQERDEAIKSLEESDKALQRAHNELEKKVNDRTRQLQETLMELEKQHEKLKSTQSKLVESEKMASLGTLVAGVAHEINNPINYTYLSSKVLEKDLGKFKEELMYLLNETDDEVRNFFEENFIRFSNSITNILDGSNQVKTIVQDLRLFSRLDEADKKEIYVSEALETTIRLVKTQYTKQIQFTTDFQTDGKIECYPSQLNQVFFNIIVNACQAIIKKQKDLNDETKGLLNVTLLDNHKEIVIVFHDNGCGMNEEIKSKIFEPFFTTKPIGQGTGLGMSISYGIIERHEGNIEVKSQVGKGTTITISLPYEMNSDYY